MAVDGSNAMDNGEERVRRFTKKELQERKQYLAGKGKPKNGESPGATPGASTNSKKGKGTESKGKGKGADGGKNAGEGKPSADRSQRSGKNDGKPGGQKKKGGVRPQK